MFCKTCGKEVNDSAVVCPHCGCPITATNNVEVKKGLSWAALAGMIIGLVSLFLSFYGVVPAVGCVLSAIGLNQVNKKGKSGKGFAITGLVVSIIGLVWALLTLVFISSCVGALSTLY